MDGDMFQVCGERRRKWKFQDTLDKLYVYASVTFTQYAYASTPLFEALDEPQIERPKEPEKTTWKDEDGNNITYVVDVDPRIYNEKVKQYVKDVKSLKHTTRTMYNIVLGQCSKVIKQRVKANNEYADILKTGNVHELLKHVRHK